MGYTEAITALLSEHDKIFSPNERPAYTRSEALLIAANFLEKEGINEEKARQAAFNEKKKQGQAALPFGKHNLARLKAEHQSEQERAEQEIGRANEARAKETAEARAEIVEKARRFDAIESENRAFAAVKKDIADQRAKKKRRGDIRVYGEVFTEESEGEEIDGIPTCSKEIEETVARGKGPKA